MISSSILCKMHERRPCRAPRAGGGLERVRTVADESPLLLRRKHERTPLRIVLDGAEDAAVGAEIGMAHVRALDDALEREGETTEVFHRRHRGRIL